MIQRVTITQLNDDNNVEYGDGEDDLTFLPHADVLAHSNVFAPGFLDDTGVAVELPLPHLFKQEQLCSHTHNRVFNR